MKWFKVSFLLMIFFLSFQAGAKVTYKMVPINDGKSQFPILTEYSDRKILQSVNDQIQTATKDMQCDVNTPKDRSFFEVKSKVDYTTNDIFSIYATASYFCASAYPTIDANTSMTFDLKSGKRISFAELFLNYEDNMKNILSVVFAAEIEKANKLLASKPANSDGCDSELSLNHILENGPYFQYNFTEQGLAVQPEWPHVIAACATRVIVPYANLKPFADPKGILARVQ